MSNELAELKKQADEMGLAYHPNIGAAKLAEKIAAAQADSPEAADEVFDDAPVPDDLAAVADAQAEAVTPNPAPPAALEPAKPVQEMCTVENVTAALAPLVARGLKIVALNADYWHIRTGMREDSGTMKMPLNTLKTCANLLMTRTAAPTEGMDVEEIMALKIGQVR